MSLKTHVLLDINIYIFSSFQVFIVEFRGKIRSKGEA